MAEYSEIQGPHARFFLKRQQLVRKLETGVAPEVFPSPPVYDGDKILLRGTTGQFNESLGNGPTGMHTIRVTKTTGYPVDFKHLPALISNRGHPAEIARTMNLLQLLLKQLPNQRVVVLCSSLPLKAHLINRDNANNARAYYTSVGRQVINRRGAGFELWQGFHQSVRPTISKLLINVDTTVTAMYQSGPAISVAMSYLGLNDARKLALHEDDREFRVLERHLKGLKILVLSSDGKKPHRTKTVAGLVSAADRYKFDWNGKEVTVREYFNRAHNIELHYRGIVGVRLATPRTGNHIVQIIPLERSNRRPHERLNTITSHEKGPSGMSISQEPFTVRGNMLTPPKIVTSRNATVILRLLCKLDPYKGARKISHFDQPASLEVWAAVSLCPTLHEKDLEKLLKGSKKCCHDLGMAVADPCMLTQGNNQNPEEALNHVYNEAKNELDEETFSKLFIVVVIARQSLRSRAFERNAFWRRSRRVNGRLGGRNFRVSSAIMKCFEQGPAMIMGADVGHPGPGVQRPTIAGLTYSIDKFAKRYRAITRVQDPRLEPLRYLADMAERAFLDFLELNPNKDRTSVVPERVFFFRDGILEGEFERVGVYEIQEIEKGFEAAWGKYLKVMERLRVQVAIPAMPPVPKITYVVVGKRHHVSFFPELDSPANDGRTGNCKAGFVVDEEFANPLSLGGDFYLQSHEAIQGTSRSSHYRIIQGKNGLGIQGLEELAFSLRHLYARSTRSVSIPAPVYCLRLVYFLDADLVCRRLACYVPPDSVFESLSDNASVASGGPQLVPFEAWQNAFRPVHEKEYVLFRKCTLYFRLYLPAPTSFRVKVSSIKGTFQFICSKMFSALKSPPLNHNANESSYIIHLGNVITVSPRVPARYPGFKVLCSPDIFEF
ncbi:Piwi-domain-containing protein [Marasmius fiardii PR-910]|nr:Piwi-domain-containing protein [Marasmius fiardii PR-910]